MTDFNPRFNLDSEQDHHLEPRKRCTICTYIIWAIVTLVFIVTVSWGMK